MLRPVPRKGEARQPAILYPPKPQIPERKSEGTGAPETRLSVVVGGIVVAATIAAFLALAFLIIANG